MMILPVFYRNEANYTQQVTPPRMKEHLRPTLQPDRTNWCHDSPAEHDWSLLEARRSRTAESAVESADGHLPYALTVPGSHRACPGDPGGDLYGRTDYGRPRRSDGRFPGGGKGLTWP